jgi:Flp pilus assembly protein TadD
MRGGLGLALSILVLAVPAVGQEPLRSAATPTPTSTGTSGAAQRRQGQGDEAARGGDWRAALFAYQEACHLEPRSAELRLRLGGAYEQLGYVDEAVRAYRLAAALAPPGDEALARAARARRPRQPVSQAETPAAVPYEQGVALVAAGRFAEAAARLDEAVRADPRLAAAYTARGSALFGLARYPDAARDYQAALVLDATQATPLFGLAECHRLLGQLPAALDHYQRYLASSAPDVREELRAEARRRSAALRPGG